MTVTLDDVTVDEWHTIYTIVQGGRATTLQQFVDLVQHHVDCGWEPLGAPTMLIGNLAQAMLKRLPGAPADGGDQ